MVFEAHQQRTCGQATRGESTKAHLLSCQWWAAARLLCQQTGRQAHCAGAPAGTRHAGPWRSHQGLSASAHTAAPVREQAQASRTTVVQRAWSRPTPVHPERHPQSMVQQCPVRVGCMYCWYRSQVAITPGDKHRVLLYLHSTAPTCCATLQPHACVRGPLWTQCMLCNNACCVG